MLFITAALLCAFHPLGEAASIMRSTGTISAQGDVLFDEGKAPQEGPELLISQLSVPDGTNLPLTQQTSRDTASLSILWNFTKRHNHVDEHSDQAEIDRCKRYGFQWRGRDKKRRIFMGALIADDSWHAILAHAAEAKDLYYATAFVESNRTLSYEEAFRPWRFTSSSQDLKVLRSGIFGSSTKVTVDYHIDNPANRPTREKLDVEKLAREKIADRWKRENMTEDDIGIVCDLDEFFTRDFLLAAQSCDIPQFRPGNDCRKPKLLASTRVFESSPNCVVDNRRWFHPDMLSGQCIDKIGNAEIHKPGRRKWNGLGARVEGYGTTPDDYSKMPDTKMYPLWKPDDFRMLVGGQSLKGPYLKSSNGTWKDHGVTGFHLHNYFYTSHAIRYKYLTYGHRRPDAFRTPLGQLSQDLELAVKCAQESGSPQVGLYWLLKGGFDTLQGPAPIAYKSLPEYIKARHEEFKQILLEDERKYGK